MSDATEEPTPRRLRRAQEEGESPVSPFASQAVAFLCAVAVAPAAIAALATHASADLRSAIARAGEHGVDVRFAPLPLAGAVVALTAPILLAAAVGAAASALVQSGGVVAKKRLQPRLARLNVASGLAQLVSTARLVAVLRAAVFGAAVAYFAYGTLRAHAGDLARTAGRMPEAASLAGVLAFEVVERTAILGVMLAVLDVVVTRRAWRKKLMMTRSEVQRERKETEGDPLLRSARDRARGEWLTTATLPVLLASVEHATVVIASNERERPIAAALRYDAGDAEGEAAPVLVATGRGDIAVRILDAARTHGVPITQDPALARALANVERDTAIPEIHYEAVAEILRDVWADADATRHSTLHEDAIKQARPL